MQTTNLQPGLNRVSFKSEGIDLIGHLYLPDNYQPGNLLPGIIVGGSWTTVKEQMAGLYARQLAKEGFATLAFDHRYYGESGGSPRFFENPTAKTEDFINALHYLQSVPAIDPQQIGGLAICASGGYMGDAISRVDGFQSFVAVVPWFNTEEVVRAFYGGPEGIQERIEKSRAAEKTYQAGGGMTYIPSISDTDPSAAMYGPFEYYLSEDLGKVPNWSHDRFALSSWEPWLTYRPVSAAAQIDIPTLIISSKDAATPAADEAFYQQLAGPKEMMWMEGGQLDFYYQPKLVRQVVDQVNEHFQKTLQ